MTAKRKLNNCSLEAVVAFFPLDTCPLLKMLAGDFSVVTVCGGLICAYLVIEREVQDEVLCQGMIGRSKGLLLMTLDGHLKTDVLMLPFPAQSPRYVYTQHGSKASTECRTRSDIFKTHTCEGSRPVVSQVHCPQGPLYPRPVVQSR